MLLILGSTKDLCVRETHALLIERGIPTVLHEKGFADSFGLNWLLDDDNPAAGYFRVDGRRIPFDAITGVLVRDFSLPAGDKFSKEDGQYVQSEIAALKLGVLGNLDCPVINRPKPGIAHVPTKHHIVADAVRQCGLELPPWLTTGNSASAREFMRQHGCRVLARPPAHRPVMLADSEGLARFLNDFPGPLCLQAVPAGRWLRVVIAGEEVIGTTVDESDLLLSAVEPAQWSTVALPAPLAACCRRVSEQLDLPFLELLVVEATYGGFHCLNLNEFPSLDRLEPTARRAAVHGLVDVLEPSVRTIPMWDRTPNPSPDSAPRSRRAA